MALTLFIVVASHPLKVWLYTLSPDDLFIRKIWSVVAIKFFVLKFSVSSTKFMYLLFTVIQISMILYMTVFCRGLL